MIGYFKPLLWDTLNPMKFVRFFADEGEGGGSEEGKGEGKGEGAGSGEGKGAVAGTFTWHDRLPEDMRNSPTTQKYADTPEGLQGAVKGLHDLTHMLGQDKVVIPKDPNDSAAWANFNKAMGVPEKSEGYSLADVTMPDAIKEVSFDKNRFQEIVHKYGLTPSQAQGLWKDYTEGSINSYNQIHDSYVKGIEETRSSLMKEWGDAYPSKVDLGQKVINKFAGDQDTATWITEAILKDPRGAKFLAGIGESFSENQIGDFEYKRQSLTPSEAQSELAAIRSNPNHPYNDAKALQKEHDAAVEHVNMLLAISAKTQ